MMVATEWYQGVSPSWPAPAGAVLAVALIVCDLESTLSRNTWRRPQPRDRRYLTALIGWGYQPSDVERLILAEPKINTPVRASKASRSKASRPRKRRTPNPATTRATRWWRNEEVGHDWGDCPGTELFLAAVAARVEQAQVGPGGVA